MLAANQQMMRQAWPFLAAESPVIVDCLPWSHTFGGNHNMGMVLTNGGTLYIDTGRPAPGLFAQTITNLSDIAPTIYFDSQPGTRSSSRRWRQIRSSRAGSSPGCG